MEEQGRLHIDAWNQDSTVELWRSALLKQMLPKAVTVASLSVIDSCLLFCYIINIKTSFLKTVARKSLESISIYLSSRQRHTCTSLTLWSIVTDKGNPFYTEKMWTCSQMLWLACSPFPSSPGVWHNTLIPVTRTPDVYKLIYIKWAWLMRDSFTHTTINWSWKSFDSLILNLILLVSMTIRGTVFLQ